MWRYTGLERPPFAEAPGPGEQSVWDFPRPPRLEAVGLVVEVRDGPRLLASTGAALRVLETAAPPTYYLPPEDVDLGALSSVSGGSMCEWKGRASYLARAGEHRPIAWTYAEPRADFHALAGYLSFYPALVDCYVGGEKVRPQPGGFYGGWITSDLTGPFKGESGSEWW